MMKFRRQITILALLVLITAIYLNGTRIFSPNSEHLDNHSYLGTESGWNTLLFGKRKQWDGMQSYIRLHNEYEDRRNYGLMNHSLQAQYMGRFSSLASNAFSDWQSYHIRSYSRQLTGTLRDELAIDDLVRSNRPLAAVGILAAVYTGRTLRYRLNTDMSLETRTAMENSQFSRQYMGWRSNKLAASAGSSYGNDSSDPVALHLRKQLTSEVSVNYDKSNQHAVGVSYSKGF